MPSLRNLGCHTESVILQQGARALYRLLNEFAAVVYIRELLEQEQALSGDISDKWVFRCQPLFSLCATINSRHAYLFRIEMTLPVD